MKRRGRLKILHVTSLLGVIAYLLVWVAPAHSEDLADHWNPGSLGATADLVEGRVVARSLMSDQPAEGKLEVGDVPLRAGGESLGDTPFWTLGRVLDIAEKKGVLVLEVERGGDSQEVKLNLRKVGSYAGAFAAKNAKVKKLMKRADP